jgi:hypothetical protein
VAWLTKFTRRRSERWCRQPRWVRLVLAALGAVALVAPARASAQGTLVITCDTVIAAGPAAVTVRGPASRCLGTFTGTLNLDGALRPSAVDDAGEAQAREQPPQPPREVALTTPVEVATGASSPEQQRVTGVAVGPRGGAAGERGRARPRSITAPRPAAGHALRPAAPRAPPARRSRT